MQAFRHISQHVRQMRDLLTRFVWPGHCPACDVLLMPEEELFCWECMERVHPAAKLAPAHGMSSEYAVYEYGDEVRTAILRWKYEGSSSVGYRLTKAFEKAACATIDAFDVHEPMQIVPVPMHPAHLRRRGFDHAYLLARALHRGTSRVTTTLAPNLLTRLRDTPRQAGLDRAQRTENLCEAFQARVVSPLPIILVDDIVTTGATLSACAVALRAQGAGDIHAVTLARACQHILTDQQTSLQADGLRR